MKFLAITVVALLAFIAYRLSEEPRKEAAEANAVHELEQLVSGFPKDYYDDLNDWRKELHSVTYNVRKSDSVSAPLIGIIGFSQTLYTGKDVDYELIYHWRDGAWRYQHLVCLTPDVNVPLFEASMALAPEIRCFTQHGKLLADVVSAAIAEQRRERQAKKQQGATPQTSSPAAPVRTPRSIFPPGVDTPEQRREYLKALVEERKKQAR